MAVSDTPSQPITPAKTAEHIRALSALNEVRSTSSEKTFVWNSPLTICQDIPALLHAAGTAISALTTRPLTTSPTSPPPSSFPQDIISPPSNNSSALQSHKALFTTSTRTYFTLISSINATLTSQVRFLEDAGVIPAEAPRLGLGEAGEGVVNGGLGGLDPGWLNARMGGGVEGKEGEILRALRKELEGEVERREGRREVGRGRQQEEDVQHSESEKMEET